MKFKTEYLSKILGNDSKGQVKKPKTTVPESGSVDMLVASFYASINLSLARNPVQSALTKGYDGRVFLDRLVHKKSDKYGRNFY